ncbi:serpin family protein [uncultured Methanospirillum sp.]|uniref:serpin family protein n=1 Tax=uncultured Methanospirillum sp. TaxID=262503 RepID=UPI00374A6913
MSHWSVWVLVLVIMQVFLGGIIAYADNPTSSDKSLVSSGEQSQTDKDHIAASNNKFSYNLFSNLSHDPFSANKNLFFSPFSVFSALAITYEGARNSTAEEMRSVLYLPQNDAARRDGFLELNSRVNSPGTDYNLTNGNALWVERTYPILDDYLNTSRTWYSVNASNLDFKSNPSGSAGEINTWAEGETAHKIQKLVDPDTLSPDTKLIITNVIYFKGSWAYPFDKNKIENDLFNLSDGRSVPVMMMHNSQNHVEYNYIENEDVQVLELPYANGKERHLSMVILLPKTSNMSAAEMVLDPGTFSQLQKEMVKKKVQISLPKFTIHERYDLSQVLSYLGMSDAFSDKADFSGIDGTHNLYISDVVHSSYVDVNEEGTEAAAGSGVVPATLSIEKNPVFRADHPFIFVIRDSETGVILFIGKMMNPAS